MSSESYEFSCTNTKVSFEHLNSLVVFMALDCIDKGFDYEMYSSYILQWSIPELPKERYEELFNIVANK